MCPRASWQLPNQMVPLVRCPAPCAPCAPCAVPCPLCGAAGRGTATARLFPVDPLTIVAHGGMRAADDGRAGQADKLARLLGARLAVAPSTADQGGGKLAHLATVGQGASGACEARDQAVLVTDSSVVVVTGPDEAASRCLANALVATHRISRVCLMSASDYASLLPPPPPRQAAAAAAAGTISRTSSQGGDKGEDRGTAPPAAARPLAPVPASAAIQSAPRHPPTLRLALIGQAPDAPAPAAGAPRAASAAAAPAAPANSTAAPAPAANEKADARAAERVPLKAQGAGVAASVAAAAGASSKAVGEETAPPPQATQGATSRWGLASLASVGKRLLDALPDD